MVKLKPAKQYLREFYLIQDGAEAYQENDIMMGVSYLYFLARKYSMPLVVCIPLGTNMGSHMGMSRLGQYLNQVSLSNGSAVITAACGEQTAPCLVTCDFAYVGAETTEEGSVPLALSKDDLTFFNAGEQYTLSVTGAPEGAKITYVSSDESIATVSSSGVLTAKGSGTTTVSVTVGDAPAMTCIVRCNFDDGVAESGDCTISNSDVTMGVKGETFQISLRDANGNKITGLLWVSSDLSICSVDGTGVVKAEGSGTAYVSTTYNGISYQCIVRCNLH